MRNFIWKYETPEGFDDLVMCGDGEALTGLWFEGSRDDVHEARGCERREMPAFQAVGGAVGWNPICIIIPCHRVIGADGSLTGYGGGLENKVSLLAREGIGMVFP